MATQPGGFFEGLTPRNRLLLSVLGGLIALVITLFIWWSLFGSLDETGSQIRGLKRKLADLQSDYAEYQTALEAIAAGEERLASMKGEKPTSFIEKKTQEHDLRESLKGIKELSSEKVGALQQTRYRVEYKRAPRRQMYELVYDVEKSGFMRIETANFKSVFHSGEKRLDLTLELIALLPAEA